MRNERLLDDIAKRMKARRNELGLCLQEVADEAGISKSTLQRYETGGIKNLPMQRLEALSSALCTTPDWLLGWTKDVADDGLIDPTFQNLLRKLNYEISVYSSGKKIVFGSVQLGSGYITPEEYLAFKESIFSYIRYNADKLAQMAEAREEERMDRELEKWEAYAEYLKLKKANEGSDNISEDKQD